MLSEQVEFLARRVAALELAILPILPEETRQALMAAAQADLMAVQARPLSSGASASVLGAYSKASGLAARIVEVQRGEKPDNDDRDGDAKG